jgi:hypothetical protein
MHIATNVIYPALHETKTKVVFLQLLNASLKIFKLQTNKDHHLVAPAGELHLNKVLKFKNIGVYCKNAT